MIDVSVKVLRELGICLYDENGEMKPLSKLIDELKDAYYRINPEKKEPLLTIELQDETSVPKVFYKGEELTGKAYVNFEWKTREEYKGTGGVNFKIEHIGKGTKSIHVFGRRNGEYL